MGDNILTPESMSVVGYFGNTLTLLRLTIKLSLEPWGGVNIQLAIINHRVFGGPVLG